MRALIFGAAMLALIAVVPAGAREQIPAEERFNAYNAKLPACDDAGVVAKIQSRFAAKESEYWNSSLTLVAITKIRATAFRPNGLDLIPRRYCVGEVTLSNNRKSRVHYSLAEDLGIIGWGYGVHFCVEAYDRNWASAPECKIARP